eukprot:COSAG02_NODE_37964_length_435_cov_0.758929_1_plen_28_part_01
MDGQSADAITGDAEKDKKKHERGLWPYV